MVVPGCLSCLLWNRWGSFRDGGREFSWWLECICMGTTENSRQYPPCSALWFYVMRPFIGCFRSSYKGYLSKKQVLSFCWLFALSGIVWLFLSAGFQQDNKNLDLESSLSQKATTMKETFLQVCEIHNFRHFFTQQIPRCFLASALIKFYTPGEKQSYFLLPLAGMHQHHIHSREPCSAICRLYKSQLPFQLLLISFVNLTHQDRSHALRTKIKSSNNMQQHTQSKMDKKIQDTF